MLPRPAAALALAIAVATPVAALDAAPPAGGDVHGRILRVEHAPLGDAPTRGPRTAPVTIEVFFSPGSELGNQAYRRALAEWRRHPARIRLVFRPLLRSDASQYVAPLAIAAHARGKFFALMDELASQPGPQPTREAVLDAAARVGLDRAAAAAATIDDDAIKAVLDANDHLSVRARVGQRADLVLNRRPLGPTPDDATLESAYQAALALARIELAAGAPATALPALAGRRSRCLDGRDRDRPRSRRGRGPDEPADPDDVDDRATPRTGWHLGTLLRDGTDCPAEIPPTGRVDRPLDYEVTSGPAEPRAALLDAPLSTAGLPSCGPAQAPVVVQVICNLRSTGCADQLLRARRLAIDYVPSVRVVYRPWVDLAAETAPLELPLAEAVMCGQRLGDGWRFVRTLLGQDREQPRFDTPARRAGIDADAFTACADAPPVAARQAIEEARAAGVGWSPTVVIGQRAYVGGFTDNRPMADVIDAELAPGLLGATDDVGAAADPGVDLDNRCDDD